MSCLKKNTNISGFSGKKKVIMDMVIKKDNKTDQIG